MRHLIFVLATFGVLNAQTSLKEFVQKNASEIKSIDLTNTEYSDLQQFGEAVGDARVVMLGEMWHGDGSSFEAKSRLVKFLHEKKGFNVLSFENDFYGTLKGYQKTRISEMTFDSLVKHGILTAWSKSQQCKPLFEYLKNDSSFKLCGIDLQIMGPISQHELKADLQDFINKSGIDFTNSIFYKEHYWNRFNTSHKVFTSPNWLNILNYSKVLMKEFSLGTDTILSQLKNKTNIESDFNYQTLKSIQQLTEMFLNITSFSESMTIRDKQMTANLEWLMRYKYPNEKFIVWVASSHLVKDSSNAYLKPYTEVPMGYFYNQNKTNPRAYYLAFTAHTGKGNFINNSEYKILKSKKGSIESELNNLKKEYAFLPINKFLPTNENKFYWSKIDGGNNTQATWHTCVDGVFFIRTMKPSVARMN